MNNDVFDTASVQAEKLLAPVKEFNKLAVANVEKLAQLQVSSLQEYSALGIAQLKAFSEVNDPASLQDYVGKQSEFLKTVGEKLASDARAVAELSKEFNAGAQQLAKESVEALAAKAA